MGALANLALHVRMELQGVCEELRYSSSGGWGTALRALRRAVAALDDRNTERLFHPMNRWVRGLVMLLVLWLWWGTLQELGVHIKMGITKIRTACTFSPCLPGHAACSSSNGLLLW